jgi:zinc protease
MFAEIKRIQDEGPDAASVAKQKEIMRRNTELASKTNSYWADGIATALRRLEDPQDLLMRAGLVASLDAASLAETARRALPADRYIRVVLYPRAP